VGDGVGVAGRERGLRERHGLREQIVGPVEHPAGGADGAGVGRDGGQDERIPCATLRLRCECPLQERRRRGELAAGGMHRGEPAEVGHRLGPGLRPAGLDLADLGEQVGGGGRLGPSGRDVGQREQMDGHPWMRAAEHPSIGVDRLLELEPLLIAVAAQCGRSRRGVKPQSGHAGRGGREPGRGGGGPRDELGEGVVRPPRRRHARVGEEDERVDRRGHEGLVIGPAGDERIDEHACGGPIAGRKSHPDRAGERLPELPCLLRACRGLRPGCGRRHERRDRVGERLFPMRATAIGDGEHPGQRHGMVGAPRLFLEHRGLFA
jgi:hypothetical protein